jgi:hypothetical protein
MKTTTFEPSHCPTCDRAYNSVTHPTADLSPRPGDATICIGCQDVFIFDSDLNLRKPTQAELLGLPLLELSKYQRALIVAKSRGDRL